MKKILEFLEINARATNAQIANKLGLSVDKVDEEIKRAEADQTILKYTTIVNWAKLGNEKVWALIEIRLTPQQDIGFDALAERIYSFPQVYSAYLVSGTYDLAIIVKGENMQEISSFVTKKLVPIEEVQSTVTHFLLKRYKDSGEFLGVAEPLKRLPVTL
ncbi:Lrp/AsnC family transcriptional regulator [bacterium]|nr:Lrp/AsnC family transcriptional regulator [bacterium]